LHNTIFKKRRKELNVMKITTSFLSASLLVSSFGVGGAFAAAEGVISKEAVSSGDYCHLKSPAIRGNTLSSARPALKNPSDGDIIDFYGPCDHDPLGKGQVNSQRTIGRPPTHS
jgi:hypothetical protein